VNDKYLLLEMDLVRSITVHALKLHCITPFLSCVPMDMHYIILPHKVRSCCWRSGWHICTRSSR